MSRFSTNLNTPVAHLVGPGQLRVVHGRLAFHTEERTSIRLNPEALEALFCYGRIGVTDQALAILLESGVHVAWMTKAGQRCRGRLLAARSGSTQLRLDQLHVLTDKKLAIRLARQCVQDKLHSQIAAARHYQRQRVSEAKTTLKKLRKIEPALKRARALNSIRGYEGAASAAWFELFGTLLLEPWVFERRSIRPPRDAVNALLSLAYTWLHTRAMAQLEAIGFDVNLGALHEYRPGRPSLACDVIEPFRVPMVDRWVIRICNESMIQPNIFDHQGEATLLKQEHFGNVLISWERFLSEGDWISHLRNQIASLATEIRRLAPRH